MKDIGDHIWFMQWDSKKRIECYKVLTIDLYVIYELFRDILMIFQKIQIWWITRSFHKNGSSTSFTTEFRGIFNPCWEWVDAEMKKENDMTRQAVFFTPLEAIRKQPRRRSISFWLHCSSKDTLWNILETRSAFGRIRENFQVRKIKDYDAKTKSFIIITYVTVARDCIDRVTSQNGDRVIVWKTRNIEVKHRRSRWRVIDEHSSNSSNNCSRSSLF